MKRKITIVWLCLVAVGCVSLDSFAENEQAKMVIIGHKSVADALKKDDIKQIFLGRKTRWADDTRIVFVILNDEHVYSAFLKEYVGKTIFQYTNYWKKQVFTGKGRMPKAFKNSKAVIEYVASTEGAISFGLTGDIDVDTVKVITIE